MSTILIATWDGGGNAGPALHLGARLRRRGHHVRVLGWHSMAARAAAAGLDFATYSSVAPWPADVQHEDAWADLEARLHGPGVAADIRAAAAAEPPDVLVVDCMLTAGFAAARELRVPTVALVHVMYQPFLHQWGDEVLHTDIAEMLADVDQVLALTPPALDDALELPANTSYVGAITAPEPASPNSVGLGALLEPGDPWVLLSLSTTLQHQREALPAMLAALGELPVRVLLTLGGALATDALPVPANVTVRAFVAHETVLPHVALVVCHGGLSTITTALAYGVALICVPQGREQPINSGRVEACGAGRVVAADAPASELRAAVREVLADPKMRAAAASFADPKAGQVAAALVEEVASPRTASTPGGSSQRARSSVQPGASSRWVQRADDPTWVSTSPSQ